MDWTYLNESMKGLGHRGGAMPRAAHRTGDDVRVPGISDLKVCVVVGVDGGGREFAGLCDRGRPTDAAVRASLVGNVGAGCAAGTDGHGAYGRVLPGLGVTNHLVFPSDGSATVARGRYGIRREGVTTEQRPFWDWWETKMAQAEAQPA